MLKDAMCPMAVFEILKRMKPLRQIEATELMVAANNYTAVYATALLAGTPTNELAGERKSKKVRGVTPEAMAKMEKELARLQESMAEIQETYGKEHPPADRREGLSRKASRQPPCRALPPTASTGVS